MKSNVTKSSKEPTKTLSLEEQQTLIKEEIQRFLKIAKEKKTLTIEEINELLPPEFISASVLDSFMQALEAGGVSITDHTELSSKSDDSDSPFLSEIEDEEVDEDEVAESEDVKGNDPVRLYLRKMGSVSLLTREGEVEIARRIEKGEREIVKAILMSPLGTWEIINLGKRLDEGRIKVKSIFRGLEDEETQYDEKEYIDKIHELIGKVTEYQTATKNLFEVLRVETTPQDKRNATIAELKVLNEKLMLNFESINFNRKTINRIVIKFKNLVHRIGALRKRIKDGVERTLSKDINVLVDRLKLIDANEKELQKMVKETGLNYNRFRSYAVQAQEANARLTRLDSETEMNFRWIQETYTAIWKGEREADAAKSELVEANLRLVVS
ncbi:MAG: RNA polymerase sigma factor RpoD, partial [Bdellovibrionales bacterium]|nr:RNA polymerase sigma factor RpoD [Bdellovibrionales bacterium]